VLHLRLNVRTNVRKKASVQILRFEDEVIVEPRKKRTSRGTLILATIGVLIGVGTAFASSTIQINGGQGVTLGQGVSQVTGCDSAINVATAAGLSTPTASPTLGSSDTSTLVAPAPTFYLKTLTLSEIDSSKTRNDGTGCGGKTLKIQLFYSVAVGDGKTEKARTCEEIGSAVRTSGSPFSCKDDAIFIPIASGSVTNYMDALTFTPKLPSDLDYVTIVSTDSV
jgi:hypothetical protein